MAHISSSCFGFNVPAKDRTFAMSSGDGVNVGTLVMSNLVPNEIELRSAMFFGRVASSLPSTERVPEEIPGVVRLLGDEGPASDALRSNIVSAVNKGVELGAYVGARSCVVANMWGTKGACKCEVPTGRLGSNGNRSSTTITQTMTKYRGYCLCLNRNWKTSCSSSTILECRRSTCIHILTCNWTVRHTL